MGLILRRVPRASTSFGATGAKRASNCRLDMPANAAMLGFCLAFAHRPLDAASLPPPPPAPSGLSPGASLREYALVPNVTAHAGGAAVSHEAWCPALQLGWANDLQRRGARGWLPRFNVAARDLFRYPFCLGWYYAVSLPWHYATLAVTFSPGSRVSRATNKTLRALRPRLWQRWRDDVRRQRRRERRRVNSTLPSRFNSRAMRRRHKQCPTEWEDIARERQAERCRARAAAAANASRPSAPWSFPPCPTSQVAFGRNKTNLPTYLGGAGQTPYPETPLRRARLVWTRSRNLVDHNFTGDVYIHAHSHPRRHELKHATGHQSPRRAARRLCVRRSPGCCARSHARLRRCWRGDSADPRRRRSASEAAARVVDLRMHRQGGQGVQHRRGAQDPRRRGTTERHRNRRQLRRESSLSERASLCEKATPRSLSQKRRRSTASTVPSAHTPRHATSHPTRHTTPLRIDAPRSPQLTAAAPRVAASGAVSVVSGNTHPRGRAGAFAAVRKFALSADGDSWGGEL